MTNDLISKSDLIEALKDSTTKESKYGDWIYETELIDLINSAPVVKSIEHEAPSAPIEGEKSGKDEALNMAIEAINMHRARYDNLVNAITNAIEIGNKPLIPSTQAPKESEG